MKPCRLPFCSEVWITEMCIVEAGLIVSWSNLVLRTSPRVHAPCIGDWEKSRICHHTVWSWMVRTTLLPLGWFCHYLGDEPPCFICLPTIHGGEILQRVFIIVHSYLNPETADNRTRELDSAAGWRDGYRCWKSKRRFCIGRESGEGPRQLLIDAELFFLIPSTSAPPPTTPGPGIEL